MTAVNWGRKRKKTSTEINSISIKSTPLTTEIHGAVLTDQTYLSPVQSDLRLVVSHNSFLLGVGVKGAGSSVGVRVVLQNLAGGSEPTWKAAFCGCSPVIFGELLPTFFTLHGFRVPFESADLLFCAEARGHRLLTHKTLWVLQTDLKENCRQKEKLQ